MTIMQKYIASLFAFLIGFALISAPVIVVADEYKIDLATLEKYKKTLDDPRPYLKDMPYKQIIPENEYQEITYDIEVMKKTWAEAVGFKATDIVKKTLELSPGKYSYTDKEKYPALKELMIPEMYKRFNAGGPPLGGNFEEIKIVPTRQYYWALPIAEATIQNAGKMKVDSDGYIIAGTYKGGYPFPKPAGKFKAQQIMYNWEKQYLVGESFYACQIVSGFNKNLKQDFDGALDWWQLRLNGRVAMEPLGWYDQRAKDNGESSVAVLRYLAPRDQYGSAFSTLSYLDADKLDSFYVYVNALRRIRKMSSTDTQDAVGGQDAIYEDKQGFSQKLSKTRYPYTYELIAEKDFLVPSMSLDGSIYVKSNGLSFGNVEFEIRPMYVVKLTQQDPNFVYGKRILYIDKETLLLNYIENFDQKGRLYRVTHPFFAFVPEMGLFMPTYVLFLDYIDLHTSMALFYNLPAAWVNRSHTDLGALMRKGK